MVDTELGKFGLSTCYDLRFPELYRQMAVAGAEVFLVASAWPYPRLEAWLLLNRGARAGETRSTSFPATAPAATGERVSSGTAPWPIPWGTPLAAAGDGECVVHAELDLAQIPKIRTTFLGSSTTGS